MKTLQPHQQALLNYLEQEPRPRNLLLKASVGAGLTEVIVRFIAGIAGKLTVIVTDHRILVDQWAYRLSGQGAPKITRMTTGSDALMELDKFQPGHKESGIIISSIPLLRMGAGRRLADALQPDLLIIDRMEGLDNGLRRDLVEGLSSRSTEVILLTHTGETPNWFQPSETRTWGTEEQLAGPISIEKLSYTPSKTEDAVYLQASSLLREAAGSDVPIAHTRSALHTSLLQFISHLSSDEVGQVQNDDDAGQLGLAKAAGSADPGLVDSGLVDSAWAVLNSLEELGDDGRLEAVRNLVGRANADNRRCIILVEGNSDADYITSYLHNVNIPASEFSTVTVGGSWQKALAGISGHDVLVVSDSALESLPELPPKTQMVWWSSPRNRLQAKEWLAHSLGQESKVVAIVSDPLLPGECDPESVLGPASDD